MARKCEITKCGTVAGNNVSHSHKKTKRTFKVNVHKHRLFLVEENRWITLKISSRALRTINKKGLATVLKQYQIKA